MMSGDDMMTTVTIGGDSMPLQAACDQAVMALNELGLRADEMNAQSGEMGLSMSGFTAEVGAALGPIGDLAGGIGQAAEQALGFITAIAGWQIIQQVISWVQQLSDELFNLQVQTQRLDTGWQYLLGGGPQNGGVQASQSMMQWSSQFSMNIPFTRQDLMTGITTLAAAGLNTQQIQQFMPYLSDIAATYGSAAYGGQGVTLAQAANAIRMASDGLSRMLKYDLNITPEELLPYGLQATGSGVGLHITDPNSLYRALENFAQAKGVAGASGNIVNTTWWGGWSSLVDNMQNFLLQVGGTNLNGTINPGSFFGNLQQGLDTLLAWFSAHRDEIKSFADTISHLLGDTVTIGGGWIGALIQQLNQLNVVSSIQSNLTNLDKTLESWFGLGQPTTTDKKHPMGGRATLLAEHSGPPDWLQQFVQAFQTIAGLSWQGAEAFMAGLIQNGPSITQTLSSAATSLQQISTALTPEEQKILLDFLNIAGGTVGVSARETLQYIAQAAATLHMDMQLLNPLLEFDGTLFDHLGQALQKVAPLLQQVAQYALLATTPFGALQQAIHLLNQELQQLSGAKLPSWLTGSALGGAALGGLLGNLTKMPGLFKQFGVTGAP